jgi:N-dimethylarginine dimethylaminohydrolase
MCRPTFYGINYRINPWMDRRRQANRALALQQWLALRRVLEEECGAAVRVCRARPGLPDMTFAANAGLVYGQTFIPSQFRYEERAGEEPFFKAWFRQQGFEIAELSGGQRFEGAGDALFLGGKLFAGYHFRTDIHTHAALGKLLGVRVYSLELVKPHFYHLDTCFAPLPSPSPPGGKGRVRGLSAIYYPGAFDSYSVRLLKEHVEDLIAAPDEEAYQFGCNAVVAGKKAVVSEPCRELARALGWRGYRVYRLKFSEFIKAGGAAKCLTLRLDEGATSKK